MKPAGVTALMVAGLANCAISAWFLRRRWREEKRQNAKAGCEEEEPRDERQAHLIAQLSDENAWLREQCGNLLLSIAPSSSSLGVPMPNTQDLYALKVAGPASLLHGRSCE